MYYIFDYVVFNLYFDDQLIDKTTIIDKFNIEVHLIENLKINIFVDNDILIVQHVKLNLIQETIKLNNCQKFFVFINVLIKKKVELKRIIRVKNNVIISIKIIVDLSIFYYDNLSNNRDFLFESQCIEYLNDDDNVFVHIIDVELNYVMIKNTIDYVVQLFKRVRFDSIIKFNQQDCYNFTFDVEFLIIED